MANKASWLTPGNVLLVGALAGGGYLVYKVVTTGNSPNSTVMPDDTSGTLEILDRIQAGDQALMSLISQLLGQNNNGGQTVTTPDGGASLPGPDGGSTPNPDESLPENSEDLLYDMSDALAAAGYSGLWDQIGAKNELDHAQNVLDAYKNPVTGFLENTFGSLEELHTTGVKNEHGEGFTMPTPASEIASLFRPSTYTDLADSIVNIGESAVEWFKRVF